VGKILRLEAGQSLDQVTQTLKLEPYDIVQSLNSGRMILIYNYRLQDRKMNLPTSTASTVIHTEESQRGGDIWYNLDYQELYLVFVDKKLSSVYSEKILFEGRSINSYDLTSSGDAAQVGGPADDFQYAMSVYQQRQQTDRGSLTEDKEAKKKRRRIIIGGTIGLLLLSSIASAL
jgi:hypothetical protein